MANLKCFLNKWWEMDIRSCEDGDLYWPVQNMREIIYVKSMRKNEKNQIMHRKHERTKVEG